MGERCEKILGDTSISHFNDLDFLFIPWRQRDREQPLCKARKQYVSTSHFGFWPEYFKYYQGHSREGEILMLLRESFLSK